MFGKYYDNRAHPRFVHILTATPYLDTEIFNIQTNALRESRKARNRTSRAIQGKEYTYLGIQRTRLKSEELSMGLRDSRLRRQEEGQEFIGKLQQSHRVALNKEQACWKDYTADRTQDKKDYMRDQIYLGGILASNSEKAASRLTTVRRWL